MDNTQHFVEQLIANQTRLRAFILASLANHANAADVLQQTNLTLWKRVDDFRPGAEFLPWALGVAKYQILAFYRDRGRDKHVFSDDVVMLMVDAADSEINELSERHEALRDCLASLPDRSRDIVQKRYEQNQSIRQIAVASRRTEDSVKCFLLRVRKLLEKCIRSSLDAQSPQG